MNGSVARPVPPDEKPERGRDREYENDRRIAAQVARLLDAGARIDDLKMLEILDLLKIRDHSRGGLTRQTQGRLRKKYVNAPDRQPTMLDLLAAHRIADWGQVRLSHATGLYQDHLPVRLLLATSPEASDVVHAELLVLAAAHDRGGRFDAAAAARQWADLVDQTEAAPRLTDSEVAAGRSVQLERLDRRLASVTAPGSDVRYVDGELLLPAGAQRDREFRPFFFRRDTASLAAIADIDPDVGLDQLDRYEPTNIDKQLLERTEVGKAALLERCFLIIETHHLFGKHHSPLLSTASNYLRRHLRHTIELTRGQDGGHHHACLTWPADDRHIFWLRATAAMRHLKIPAPKRGSSSAPGGLSGLRTDLTELAPFVLQELTTGDDPNPDLVNALSTRDALTNAWLMSPARKKAYLAVVEPLIERRQERYTATAAARTVVRNLLALDNKLAQGEVDPDVWAQVLTQMDRVAGRVQSQSNGGVS